MQFFHISKREDHPRCHDSAPFPRLYSETLIPEAPFQGLHSGTFILFPVISCRPLLVIPCHALPVRLCRALVLFLFPSAPPVPIASRSLFSFLYVLNKCSRVSLPRLVYKQVFESTHFPSFFQKGCSECMFTQQLVEAARHVLWCFFWPAPIWGFEFGLGMLAYLVSNDSHMARGPWYCRCVAFPVQLVRPLDGFAFQCRDCLVRFCSWPPVIS